MDITLERILELIPKKENGDFKHGSQKAFAETIGLKSGNLISDWINGRSKSYQNYLYEIASKYNVSVEWLEGKTDKKEPAAVQCNSDNDPVTNALIQEVLTASEEDKRKMLEIIRVIKGASY